MQSKYTLLTRTGLKRFDNEDATGIFELDGGLLCILCDGLGGNKAGEVASKLAVETIHSFFIERNEIHYLERIKLSIIEANSKILEKAASEFNLKGMATTVEALFLKNNNAYWGHVGDSRIYSIKKGKLKQLTKDHSLVQKLVDEGFLTLKEAENHPNRNIIMRALGDSADIEVDISKLKINEREFTVLFMCTDGVYGVVNDEELKNIIVKDNFDTIKKELITLIEERGAPDNYSFILIQNN